MFDQTVDLHYPRVLELTKRSIKMRVGAFTFTDCVDQRDAPSVAGIVVARCNKTYDLAVFKTANIRRFITLNRTEKLREHKDYSAACLVDYVKEYPRRTFTFGYTVEPIHKANVLKTIQLMSRHLRTQHTPVRFLVCAYQHTPSGTVVVTHAKETTPNTQYVASILHQFRNQKITTHGNAHQSRVQFKLRYPETSKDDWQRVVSVAVKGKDQAIKRRTEIAQHFAKQTTVLNF